MGYSEFAVSVLYFLFFFVGFFFFFCGCFFFFFFCFGVFFFVASFFFGILTEGLFLNVSVPPFSLMPPHSHGQLRPPRVFLAPPCLTQFAGIFGNHRRLSPTCRLRKTGFQEDTVCHIRFLIPFTMATPTSPRPLVLTWILSHKVDRMGLGAFAKCSFYFSRTNLV